MQGLVVLYSAGIVDRGILDDAMGYFLSEVLPSLDKKAFETELDSLFYLLGLHASKSDQDDLAELYVRRISTLVEQLPDSFRAFGMVLTIAEKGYSAGLLTRDEAFALFDTVSSKSDGIMNWNIQQIQLRM